MLKGFWQFQRPNLTRPSFECSSNWGIESCVVTTTIFYLRQEKYTRQNHLVKNSKTPDFYVPIEKKNISIYGGINLIF